MSIRIHTMDIPGEIEWGLSCIRFQATGTAPASRRFGWIRFILTSTPEKSSASARLQQILTPGTLKRKKCITRSIASRAFLDNIKAASALICRKTRKPSGSNQYRLAIRAADIRRDRPMLFSSKRKEGESVKAFQWMLLLMVSAVLAYSCIKERPYPSLRASLDPDLQSALIASLKKELEPEFLKAIEEKRAGVVLVDITNRYRPSVATLNGDEMMYAASLPKIAILLGAFVQIERGIMVLDDQTRQACIRMIRYSSNEDASLILNRVGMENLAEILQSDRFRLYDREFNGGLWVGKDYSEAPVWKGDPLHQFSHGATAMQVARFYYLLFTNRLLPPELTKEMQEMLSDSGLKHKFVKGLKDRSGVKIYRKSGTWKNWHADSGVIVHENFRYIIVALSELANGAEKLSRLAATVDDLMQRRHTAFARGDIKGL